MKRVITAAVCIFLAGCAYNNAAGDKTINIAVMGCFDTDYSNSAFIKGVELAVKEAAAEYAPLGFTVSHTYYNDNNDYGEGMLIVDKLVADDSVTAVIGSQNFSILEMSSHRFEIAGKMMIAPHGIPERALGGDTICTSYSAADIGVQAKEYAIKSGVKRWAVCYYDDTYNRDVVRGFLEHKSLADVTVMGYMKMPFPAGDFDYFYNQWETLGVEGVFIVPNGAEGYDVLKAVRSANKDWVVMGDYAFDVREKIVENGEDMQGFVMLRTFSVDKQRPELMSFAERFVSDGNERYDTWASHGYDCARMVIDTAVRNNTVNSGEIAQILIRDGYSGLGCDYSFKENGGLIPGHISVIQYRDGVWNDIISRPWEVTK